MSRATYSLSNLASLALAVLPVVIVVALVNLGVTTSAAVL